MLEEAYCSFETAKLLKEKDFDIPVRYYYWKDTTIHSSCYNWNEETEKYSRPTQQMAMKWLREVHKLEVTPFHEVFQGSSWWYLIEKNTSLSLITEYEEDAIYGSYEQAAEAGIKYCLENLIK